MTSFSALGINADICKAIDELGFAYPMPIQEAVIPFQLENNDNLIALAQTGTGKTAAFGLPLVQKIDTTNRITQAVILSPTRELCLQIADDLKDFSKHIDGIRIVAVYGGAGIEQQIRALKHGAQVIVATPGRLIDLKNRGIAHLDQVQTIVLDEADEMLNMGFKEDIEDIFSALPQGTDGTSTARKILFSATMSREVERIARGFVGEYKEIVVGSRNEGAENVNHIYHLVHAKDKYAALKRVVDFYPKIYGIVFCRTKLETQDVADKLIKDGYNAESLHGDLSQPQRDQTMQKFRKHTVQILVATDVAARGLDVNDLTHVINYGMPDDIESYTHRSGRTGRAGKNGTSISIVHIKELYKIRNVEKIIGKKFIDGALPTAQEICTKQLYKAMDDIMKMDVDEEQIAPFMDEINRHFEYVEKEDVIKKIVSMTFGRFLSYYADAEEIERPATKGKREEVKGKSERKGNRTPEAGYTRLFINLGKDNGFYPGVLMQLLNKNMGGKQEVGHIDLFSKFAYFEIPESDAENVMASLTGVFYRGIQIRCNPSDASPSPSKGRGERRNDNSRKDYSRLPKKENRARREQADSRRAAFGDDSRGKNRKNNKQNNGQRSNSPSFGEGKERLPQDDWRQFFTGDAVIMRGDQVVGGKKKKGKKQDENFFRGAEPDFNEEGWARRKPKKK